MSLKHFILALALISLVGCSHNPHKAEKIDTKMEKDSVITGDDHVGVKDGDLVVQKKVMMAEELRDLQYEVYSLEDHVYGNAKYGSLGLYGVLKSCKLQLSDKKLGGDGHLIWTEPIDRVSDKEEEFKVGIDENQKIVGVSDEFLKDRITRFHEYKKLLRKRDLEYQEKVDICQTEIRARQFELEKDQKPAAAKPEAPDASL
jgi:hypothetical protein